jgi:hypothetical protein
MPIRVALAAAALGAFVALQPLAIPVAGATEVTVEQGKNICRGKASAGSGCAWCGKVNCTYVACDKEACDVVIVPTGSKRKIKPLDQGGGTVPAPGVTADQ